MNNIGDLNGLNILLLQGPVGYFFKKLDKNFRRKGAKTFRIGLNAGDEFFSFKDNYTAYKDTPKKWESFIKNYMITNNIDQIYIFGDCRYYQSIATKTAMRLDIKVFVFEEGYIRPDYITLESHGVNNYSLIPRDPEFYYKLKPIDISKPKNAKPNPITNWAIVIIYYFMAKLFHFRYKNYKHHRNYSAMEEFFYGTRSLVRKIIYTYRDKKYENIIKGKLDKKYFFVPLQTYNDFQILQHSHYGSLEKFIIEVLESFSKYAYKKEYLIFKHHPIDRGRKNYKKFIFEQATELGIKDRVIVLHDIYLPLCLKHTKGTVTINSTVGLSSIYHNTPTITLGNAIYDIEGLTNKDKKLKDFWKNPSKPNKNLFIKFRQYLIKNTQLNGSFYGLMPKELQ